MHANGIRYSNWLKQWKCEKEEAEGKSLKLCDFVASRQVVESKKWFFKPENVHNMFQIAYSTVKENFHSSILGTTKSWIL